MTDEPLDPLSTAIVDHLRSDGRKSYKAIATEVGASEATVRQRVQRLVEKGYMQVVAVTNPLARGHYTAMLLLKVNGPVEQVSELLRGLPEVTFAVAVAGNHDVIVEVTCRSGEHLLSVINESIQTIPGVTAVETLMYLKLLKLSYEAGVWPTIS